LLAHTFADEILEKLGFGRGITKTRIAFVSDRSGHKEIYVMDYDGSNVYPLTSIRNIAIMPAWAPDGQKIAYAAWRGAGRPANIEIVSLAGQRLTFTQNESVTNSTPSWSPDGGSVAYSSGAGGTDIYAADWNGRSARRLTSTPQIDTSPFWNPATGRQIAFVSRRSGTPQIYTMESDGTNVQRVINDGGDAENPAWSPDGRLIAFAWQRSGSGYFDIYIHNLATGRNTQLTQNAGNNERPSRAPDGKHIAFQSNRTGTTQIYSMLADGKRVRQLTSTGRINEGPAWSGYVQ
jgi:TolB protein